MTFTNQIGMSGASVFTSVWTGRIDAQQTADTAKADFQTDSLHDIPLIGGLVSGGVNALRGVGNILEGVLTLDPGEVVRGGTLIGKGALETVPFLGGAVSSAARMEEGNLYMQAAPLAMQQRMYANMGYGAGLAYGRY
jgi:hypothetical protein